MFRNLAAAVIDAHEFAFQKSKQPNGFLKFKILITTKSFLNLLRSFAKVEKI